MEGLPDRSNFFSRLDTVLSREDIAGLFAASGWKTRMCGFDEYELESPFAELVLEDENPFLLHGAVADILANAPQVAVVLRQAAIVFVLECYGPDGGLLAEIRT